MNHRKVSLFFSLFFLITFSLQASEVPLQKSLTESELGQMRLITEGYRKMQKHYYREITMGALERFFFRMEVIAATLIKSSDIPFSENLEKLIYGSLEYMVRELKDPTDDLSKFVHHKFVSRVVRENLVSKFSGIGIEIEEKEGLYFVRKVYRDSSAKEKGILVGDQIVKIDGKDIQEFTFKQIKKYLKLPNGESVVLSVIHPGETEVVEIKLTSRVITIPSVASEHYKKEKVGFIRVAEFRNQTATEFENHLDKLIDKKVTGLIIDFRGNDGGNMEQGVAIADFFLPEGKLVCFFLKRDVGRKDQNTQNPEKDLGKIQKIVLLVDKKSGSSSEFVVGALRHYKQIPIIGTRTKGMGSLKNSFGLSDGSMLYLITSRTFLPNEKTFDAVGIEPDFKIKEPEDQLKKALALLAS